MITLAKLRELRKFHYSSMHDTKCDCAFICAQFPEMADTLEASLKVVEASRLWVEADAPLMPNMEWELKCNRDLIKALKPFTESEEKR